MPTRVLHRVVHQRAKGPVDPSFGERVRVLRAQRGFTQAQLAGGDFTKAFISHIEHGRTRVSLRAANILAGRLGIDVRQLMAPGGDSDLHQELTLVLAESQIARGEPDHALAALRTLRPTINTYRARARRLQGLAELALGRPREALEPLAEAIRLFRGENFTESAARASYDLGSAYATLDQPGEAVGLLVDAERAMSRGEVVDRTLQLKVHALLAGVFARMGDLASADLQAERATKIAEDVVDERALDTLYAGLVALRREQGDLEGALTYARKALQLHERAGREADAVHAWNNLAWIYIERQQFGRADDALAKAERLRRERNLGALGHLKVTRAKLELARGHPADALARAREAADDPTLQRTSRAQALFIAARALAETDAHLPEVRKAFDAALVLYKDEPARRRARVHEAYAAALAARGRAADAYAEAQRALQSQRA